MIIMCFVFFFILFSDLQIIKMNERYIFGLLVLISIIKIDNAISFRLAREYQFYALFVFISKFKSNCNISLQRKLFEKKYAKLNGLLLIKYMEICSKININNYSDSESKIETGFDAAISRCFHFVDAFSIII